MRGLQQLNIGDYFDNDAAAAVLRTIRFNTELRVLFMESILYDDERIDREIDFYLRLNHAGRKLLAWQEEGPNGGSSSNCGCGCFPLALWSNVLARADARCSSDTGAPDVLYYLLREKPDLFGGIQS